MFATGDDDKTIQLWDFAIGEHSFTFRHNIGMPKSLVFSSNGKIIACLNSEDWIQIWNVESGKRISLIRKDAHLNIISDITFSKDGNIIATSK